MKRKNMLDFLLDARMSELGELSDYDLKYVTRKIDENKPFEKLMNYVENLSLPSNEKYKLSDMIFELEASISNEFTKYNFRYYKLGVSDAVNLLFDSKEYKKNEEN